MRNITTLEEKSPFRIMATPVPVLQLTFTCLIALFWTVYVFVASLWEILKKGPSRYFHVKDRSQTPQVLDNPEYGTHVFVKLSKVFILI